MSTTQESTGKLERIVVGVDGSESSKDALAWAARQAKVTGATLAVISAWEDTSIWGRSPGWLPGVDPQTNAVAALDETIREALGSEPGVDLTKEVIEGHPAPKLLEESKTASLIVVGSSGHGEFAGMLLGSVSAFLVTHAYCPVAIIRDHGGADEREHAERIVVGIDGSRSSPDALAWASRQAGLTRAPLSVVIAWHYPTDYGYMNWLPEGVDFAADAKSVLDQTIEEVLGPDPGISLTAARVQGPPSLVLVDESETAALLVVGCRGHGEFAGMLLGSVSEFVAAHAHCPVIIVRGDAAPRG